VANSGSERKSNSLGVFFCLAICLLSLSGCEKIRSYFRPKPKTGATSHEPATPKPPHKPSLAGARLAVILDDLGSDQAAAETIFTLSSSLTISVLPNHEHSAEIAENAHRHGVQVMLHVPMESLANEAPEPHELHAGMTRPQVKQTLQEMLATVPHAAGVNNHQGSRATSDPALMNELMPFLRARKLFFIDSRTTAATVAYESAQHAGVRCAFRNVPFLDDVQDEAAIRGQLELAIRGAKEKGEAIAIGHPHPETLRALKAILPQAEAQGVRLVHASDLIH
jgi:uncharacterized protein